MMTASLFVMPSDASWALKGLDNQDCFVGETEIHANYNSFKKAGCKCK